MFIVNLIEMICIFNIVLIKNSVCMVETVFGRECSAHRCPLEDGRTDGQKGRQMDRVKKRNEKRIIQE